MKNIQELEIFSREIEGKIVLNYDLKKTNWFNIGGIAKAFFKPESLIDLVSFLKKFGVSEKYFILGAGSNILINDKRYEGVAIRLGKNFSNISILPNKTIIAGSGVTDKRLSDFALEISISGFEFLSCIPGTVGGGLKINSGCFGREFKDILLSIQAIDQNGQILTIPASKIKFGYRENDLDGKLIFLSASFKGYPKNKEDIRQNISILKNKKNENQPTRSKTGGSTFKNPTKQTDEKVWKLIKKSVPLDTKFGDAEISQKHCNFFINKNNATYKDMKNLIDYVKEKVNLKTDIKLETEIIIIE